MKFNFEKCKEKFRSINYSECFFNFLGNKSRWIILVSFLILVIFCGFIWYKYQYHPQWNSKQKEDYINSKEKEVVLDKTKFNNAILQQEKRGTEYEKNIDNSEDIFRLGERSVEK